MTRKETIAEGIDLYLGDWRSFLTAEEKAVLVAADQAKASWLKLNKERAGITNRAIQRAKYAARTS